MTTLDFEDKQKNIADLLIKEGFSRNQAKMMLSKYTQCQNNEDLSKKSSKIFQAYQYNDVIAELKKPNKISNKILQTKIDYFKEILKLNNLSASQVIALNSYTYDSEKILNYKRKIKDKIEMMKKAEDDLKCSLDYVDSKNDRKNFIVEFLRKTATSSDNKLDVTKAENLIDKLNFSQEEKLCILGYLTEVSEIQNLDQTIENIDKSVKNQIPYNMVFYRAIKGDYLYQIFPSLLSKLYGNFGDLVGKKIEETGYLSTSALLNSSFANSPKCDIIFEIFAPKGSQAYDVSPFSTVFDYENEMLFNSCDLYIFDCKKIKVENNEKVKLSCFLLSKERSCYKDIDQELDNISNDL